MPNASEISKEVERFYRAYMDAFNHQEITRSTEFIDLPYALMSGDEGLIVCATEDEHQRLSARIFADLKSRGWARSEIGRVRISLLAENHALILADISRRRADGSLLQRNRFCYTARHDGSSWKMMAYLPVADGYLGPGNFPR